MSTKLSEKIFNRLFRDFLSEYDHPEQAENLFHLIFHEILFLEIHVLYKYQDELTPRHFQAIFDTSKDDAEYVQLRECISSQIDRDLDFYEKYIVEAADRTQISYERRRHTLKEGLMEFLKCRKFKQGDLKIPPKHLRSFNEIMSELVNEEVTREYYLSIYKNSLMKALDQILNEFADNYKGHILFRMKQLNFNLLDTGPEAIQNHKNYLLPGHLNRLEEFICQEPYSLYITLKTNSNRECSQQKEIKSSPLFTKIEERARIHKEMFEQTTLMPHCLNRSIIRLIYNVEMRILQNIPWITVESLKFNLDNEMRNEIQFLEQYSKAEGPSKVDALEAIKCLQSRSTDWEFVLKNLENILRRIQALNLTKIKCLVKNLDETVSIVKNQHLIVFLGNTGAGKSTTIHFLAGSKMMQTKIDNIPTIQPVSESNDPRLKKVTVSPLPVSETRDIIPIEIKLDSIFHERNKIILLDTPGFEDTEGPEVDIANRVKLINVLRAAASVKIVLVHSSKNGERSTGIRRLAKHLEEIFPSIEEYGSTFTHFFTKYPSNSEDQKATIEELKSMHCDSEPKEFQGLISTMKRTACHFIEPLKPDLRVAFLRELATTNNVIKFPEEVFKFGTSSSALRVFETQILTHQKEIFAVLNDAAPDYALLRYKLDELKFYDNLLHESTIVNEKYDKCAAELRTKITKICDDITIGFKEKLLKGAMSVDEEIKKYKHLQEIEREMKIHLRDFHPTHQINLQIVKLSRNITEKVSKSSRDEVFNHVIELNGLKTISDIFDETSIFYHQSCKDLQALIGNSIVALKDLIFTNQFEMLASEINQINRLKNEFQNHLCSEEIEEKIYQSKECLKSALNMPSDLSATLENGIILKTEDISKFDHFFAMLDSAMISFKGTRLEEEFAHLPNFHSQKIIEIFKKLTEEVKENLKKPSFEQHSARIESNMKYISSIWKISSIRAQVSLEFLGLKNALRNHLTELKSKIEKNFSQNFNGLNTLHNSKELINCLQSLISTKWLEDLQLIDYPEIISALTRSIASILKNFEERTFDFEIDEKVEIFSHSLLSKIQSEIPNLKNLFPEIASRASEAEESFLKKMLQEISSIPEKTGLNNSDPKRLKLKTCTRAMTFLGTCSIIPGLKEKSMEHKEILISSIKKGYIASKLTELESLNESITDSAEHRDKVFGDVAHFVCSFNEIIDIQCHYPMIFSLFPNSKSFVNYWEKRLLEQFNAFDMEMGELLEIKNFSGLKNKIFFVKSLRGLDLYFKETKSYQELVKRYNCKLTSEIDKIKMKLEKNLQNFEYRMVAENLELLESLGIKEVIYQNQYKNSLWELTQQTKNSIVKLITLTVEEGDNIWQKLRSLESSFKYMGQYNQEITQEMIFGEIRLVLDEKLKWFTDGINGLIHAHKFTEAENELSQIKVIKQLLGKYMSSETIILMEQLIINKNEFITKELVEDFSNVDNLPYRGEDLRQLLIRLHDAKEKNMCDIYNKAYRDIHTKLVSNFKDRLDKFNRAPDALQKHLPKLNQALNALPCNLKTILHEEIEAVLQKVDFTKEFNFDSPKNKIESDLEGEKVIQNVYSDLVLDVPGQSNDEGAQIWQYESNKTKAQHFEISKIEDKEYYRIQACCSGLFLDVASASNKEDGVVWQWGWNGTFAQLWKIEPAEYGYYTITNVGSGLLLSIKEDSEKAELAVVQQKDSGSYRDKWKLVLPADIWIFFLKILFICLLLLLI